MTTKRETAGDAPVITINLRQWVKSPIGVGLLTLGIGGGGMGVSARLGIATRDDVAEIRAAISAVDHRLTTIEAKVDDISREREWQRVIRDIGSRSVGAATSTNSGKRT